MRNIILVLFIIICCTNLVMADSSSSITKTNVYVGTKSKAANLAANELCTYLSKMTKKEYSKTGIKEKAGIIITINNNLKPDSFNIYKNKDKLIIEGGNSRGCLYGSYHVLETLGVTWPLPTKAFEFTPKISTVRWGNKYSSEPALERRGYSLANVDNTQYILDFIDYMGKQKCNYIFMHNINLTGDRLKQVTKALQDREMYVAYGGHGLPKMLPRELFDSHPEYFRMINGKRSKEYNLCPSSEAALDIVSQNIKNWISKYSQLSDSVVFQIWPDDLVGIGWCHCPKCKNLSESDQYMMVLNGIGKRNPNFKDKISFLSYHTTLPAPEKIKPSSNISPLMYAPRERCYKHAIGECNINKEYENFLKKNISKLPKDADVFEYYYDCVLFRHLAFPLHKIIGEDVKRYISNGASGIIPLHFGNFSDLAYGINIYVTAKSLWRGEGSETDAINFCKEMYGNAWQDMKTYYDELEIMVSTATETCGYRAIENPDTRYPMKSKDGYQYMPFEKIRNRDIQAIITPQRILKADVALTSAYSKADKKQKARIKSQEDMWTFTKKELEVIKDTVYVTSVFDETMASNNKKEKKRLTQICKLAAQKELNNGIFFNKTIKPTDFVKYIGDKARKLMADSITDIENRLSK